MALLELEAGVGILVLGAARSGIAAAQAARRMLPDTEVSLADRDPQAVSAADRGMLADAGVRLELGRVDAALLDGCSLVVKSPGIPGEIPLIEEAHQRGIPVWGEVEFAWRFLENPLVGVTGTNGKTTTTELIGHILRNAGWPCRVAGNVGMPLSSLIGAAGDDEILVVELSSFQLEDSIELRPDVAVLLNLAEDHLDRHPDLKSYHAAKMMIFSNQQPDDLAVLNLDDPAITRLDVPGRAGRLWFSYRPDRDIPAGAERRPAIFSQGDEIHYDPPALIALSAGIRSKLVRSAPQAGSPTGKGRIEGGGGEDSSKVINWPDAALKGDHNRENASAAIAVCLSLGVSPEDAARGLMNFPGVPHRLQVVGSVNGVTYVNDSKATNVDAAIKALTAFSGGIYLILGGSLKGCSFDRLAEAAGSKVKQAIVIGEAAAAISESFQRAGREVTDAGDLEEALNVARAGAGPGDVVLLSPACASFDQFQDYVHRGEMFGSLVKEMGLDPE
jgi:UDP-N-acetylmuramoylalanine--D-glutamate ligase